MKDEIKPGVYPQGAPPATEIVCIKTKKVFDFCFQQDLVERVFPVTEPGVPSNVDGIIECNVTQTRCTELGRNEVPDKPGFYAVSLQVSVNCAFTVATSNGGQETFARTFTLPKTVVLCTPAGTHLECDVSAVCTCTLESQQRPAGFSTDIVSSLQLWLVVTSYAEVAMLVPSYGLCTPAPYAGATLVHVLPHELLPPRVRT